jgi:hypothetical protein
MQEGQAVAGAVAEERAEEAGTYVCRFAKYADVCRCCGGGEGRGGGRVRISVC